MELRSCRHLHFIQAIKGGLVTKAINVDHGRPALKFKKVEELYASGDIKSHDSLPTFRPKVEFEDSPIDHDRAKAESASMLAGERTTLKSDSETSESNCNVGDSAGNFELCDLNFGSMTLKQIKERCKGKKRKHSGDVDLSKATTKAGSLGKQDQSSLQSMEDECDVTEPLSCWKSRILRNKKAKRNCRKNSVSTSSQNILAIVKSEEIFSDQVIFQAGRNLPAPIDIKVEVPEPSYSDGESMGIVSVISSCDCNESVASSGVVSVEESELAIDCALETQMSMISSDEPETAKDCAVATGMSMIHSEEPKMDTVCSFETQMSIFLNNEPQFCVINEESYEYMDNTEPKSILDLAKSDREVLCCQLVKLSLSELKEEDSVTDSYPSDEPTAIVSPSTDHGTDVYDNSQNFPYIHETDDNCGLGNQTTGFFSNEAQCCVVNEESYEYVEHADSKSILDERTSAGEVISHQFSHLPLSGPKEDDSAIGTHANDNSPETVSPSKDHSVDAYNGFQSFPSVLEKLWKTNSNGEVQEPNTATDSSFQCMELNNRHGSCLSDDGAKDDTPHHEANIICSPVNNHSSFWNSNLCSSPDGCLVSVADDTNAEEMQYPSSVCAVVERSHSAVIHSYTDNCVTSSEVEDCQHANLQHPPERLFSTRKAISPTSQKRLCKAMESTELDDEQYYKYTRKLCYMNVADNKIGRPEGANQIKKAEVPISAIIRKPKKDKNGLHHKGILKLPHSSRDIPCFSTGCTSVQSCSESAITFSQQQMRDIETIATKLTKELKSMKDIVEDTLHSAVYPVTSLRYSSDEVRIAIQNATRVEESARRWLSVMARDCNRFCKIMKLTEKGSAASENMVYKKRKIVFADEAGGRLCDVKTFENDMASSFMESNDGRTGIVD